MDLPEGAQVYIERVLREWAKLDVRKQLVNELRPLLHEVWLAGHEAKNEDIS